MAGEVVFVTATYLDVAAAEADHRVVSDLCAARGDAAPFEVVTIGRKATREARLHRLADGGGPETGRTAAPGLAAGLAAVLYPSVAADVPLVERADRAALSAIAGALSSQLGRGEQMDLGNHLDPAPAALIAAVAPAAADSVRAALGRAGSVRVTSVMLDLGAIEQAGTVARRIS